MIKYTKAERIFSWFCIVCMDNGKRLPKTVKQTERLRHNAAIFAEKTVTQKFRFPTENSVSVEVF